MRGYTVSGPSSCSGNSDSATCSKVNYCDVLYEANSPTLPQLKAAEVNFPYYGHFDFGQDYAYHVSAEITTPQSGSYGGYEDLYLLGCTGTADLGLVDFIPENHSSERNAIGEVARQSV